MDAVHLPSTSAAKADVTIRHASVATEASNAVILIQSMMEMAIKMLRREPLKPVQMSRETNDIRKIHHLPGGPLQIFTFGEWSVLSFQYSVSFAGTDN